MSLNNVNIDKFREKYFYNLENFVMPHLEKFEDERKIRFVCASLLAIIISVIAVLCIAFIIYITTNTGADYREVSIFKPFLKFGGKKLIPLAFFACIYLWKKIQQDFEYKIKNNIMPLLISAFEKFQWVDTAPDEYYQDVLDSDIFPYYNNKKIWHAYSDYFVGEYNGVKLEFSQAMYDNKNYNFKGGMIRIKMNKDFAGETVLRPKKVFYKDLSNMEFEEVSLEDPEFDKNFNIYTTDQIESRYLLTTGFMEKLKNISSKFSKTDNVYCSFYKDCIYIAPEQKDGMFALFGLTKRVDDIENLKKLLEQIISVIDLIEYLKLNIKIGL